MASAGVSRPDSHSTTGWALTVLSLLREGPMHPYEVQRLVRQQDRDGLLALHRGSLYHTVVQLRQEGLIESVETTREGRRPERTVYRLTSSGEQVLAVRLRELLARPVRERSPFMTALAHLFQLPPEEVLEQLQMRVLFLEQEVTRLEEIVSSVGALTGRAAVVEMEYARAMRQAELAWVSGLVDDLRGGRFTWSAEQARWRAGQGAPSGRGLRVIQGAGKERRA
jgi:DNA-binding PadR family transcriptional regulator